MAALDPDRTIPAFFLELQQAGADVRADSLQTRKEHRPCCGSERNAEDHLFDAYEQQAVCERIDRPSPWGHGVSLQRQCPEI
jgi:hypothetical protein